jgi:hypothetical protein
MNAILQSAPETDLVKLYRVTAGDHMYVMQARNLQVASQFVRHWPGVTLRRIRMQYTDVEPSHDALCLCLRCAPDVVMPDSRRIVTYRYFPPIAGCAVLHSPKFTDRS